MTTNEKIPKVLITMLKKKNLNNKLISFLMNILTTEKQQIIMIRFLNDFPQVSEAEIIMMAQKITESNKDTL